jgi:tRNA threonylcarbamoyladenosine biosynthesis protein TsaB
MILSIDTATEYAGVCLSRGSEISAMQESDAPKNHASFLQPAIRNILQQTGFSLSQIDAVAVSNGPGSYTGLRVGLASAKGICYALNKPLILINTLQVMAKAMLIHFAEMGVVPEQDTCLCPMIDARRMEVFTACFDPDLNFERTSEALVLDDHFRTWLPAGKKIFFCGNGSLKLEPFNLFPSNHFLPVSHRVNHLAILAETAYNKGSFADLAYAEPYYCKAFYSPPPKKSQKHD